MGPHEGVSRKIFLNANAGQGGEKNGGGSVRGANPQPLTGKRILSSPQWVL